MKTFRISNRVFWAGVVLASAALIGRNGGQAQPPGTKISAEVQTRQLVIVDDAGKPIIMLGSGTTKKNPVMDLAPADDSCGISLMTLPSGNTALVFSKHGKRVRVISSNKDLDALDKPEK